MALVLAGTAQNGKRPHGLARHAQRIEDRSVLLEARALELFLWPTVYPFAVAWFFHA